MDTVTRPRSWFCLILLTLIPFFFLLLLLEAFLLSAFKPDGFTLQFGSTDSLPDLPVPEREVRFRSDGTFKISIFEDLHYGEAENTLWGPVQDLNSTRVMNAVLDAEKPDLAILNGDLITGDDTHSSNSTDYLDQLLRPLIEHQTPWASTYGNHDRDTNLDPVALLLIEQSHELSMTQNMIEAVDNEAGVTNYFVLVYPSTVVQRKRHGDNDAAEMNGVGSTGSEHSQASETPALILYFLDSRGGKTFKHGEPVSSEIHSDALAWLRTTSEQLNSRFSNAIPSLLFFHIPYSTTLDFQNSYSGGHLDPHKNPGINDDIPLDAQSDKGAVLDTLRQIRGLRATFSAHDHGLDWCFRPTASGSVLNFFSCFGRHTGYGGYGTWDRGSRIVQLDLKTLDREIATWVRLEDRSISGQVVLNRTFGNDEYAAVVRRSRIT